jgi:hypothetical protein
MIMKRISYLLVASGPPEQRSSFTGRMAGHNRHPPVTRRQAAHDSGRVGGVQRLTAEELAASPHLVAERLALAV